MKLDEARRRLGYQDPTFFFLRQEQAAPAWTNVVRGSGLSSHMLLEAYLDFAEGSKLRKRNHRPGSLMFVVECLTEDAGLFLRRRLEEIHEALGLDVDLQRFLFYPAASKKPLRGLTFYSWGVFCDHQVKENRHQSNPLFAPFCLARTLVEENTPRSGKSWRAYGRDHWFLFRVSEYGKTQLLNMSPSPVTVVPLGDTKNKGVTWPASENREIQQNVRLRNRFTL